MAALHCGRSRLRSDPGFPGGARVKNLPATAGDERDMGSVPGFRRSLGEGTGDLLQYSCLENSMDREVWWTIVQ